MTDKTQITCISCRLVFESSDEHKLHYKTDLHRFNLKRKVANLPPVDQETFDKIQIAIEEKQPKDKRTLKQQAKKEAHEARIKEAQKKLDAEEAGQDTIPQPNIVSQQEAMDTTDSTNAQTKGTDQAPSTEDMTEEQMIEERLKVAKPLPVTACLFCRHSSPTMDENVEHMTKVHGLFIPDIEYLTNLTGLIEYLGEKVGVGWTCLYCNGKGRGFGSVDSVQSHMRDLGHCKIQYDETTDEFDEFYDFSKDWDGVPRGDGEDETNIKGATIADNGYELILPNGKVIGHRALSTVYNQRIRPEESRESVLINKILQSQRTLTYTDEWRAQHENQLPKGAYSRRDDYHMKLGVKANKLQTYFRHQLLNI